MAGQGNIAEGNQQRIIGIANYLRGERNSVKGIQNIGIGSNL